MLGDSKVACSQLTLKQALNLRDATFASAFGALLILIALPDSATAHAIVASRRGPMIAGDDYSVT